MHEFAGLSNLLTGPRARPALLYSQRLALMFLPGTPSGWPAFLLYNEVT